MCTSCMPRASQAAQLVKNLPTSARDTRGVGLIPGLERTPGEGNGNPLQYSCLENSMDGGAWQATVHGVTKELDTTERLSMPTDTQKLRFWHQQHMNRELPDVQAGFRKGRGTRDQIANIRWIIKKAREFQKNIYFCFIDYAKAFDCGKFLKRLEYQTTWLASWEICMQVKKQQLELDMEQQTGSK